MAVCVLPTSTAYLQLKSTSLFGAQPIIPATVFTYFDRSLIPDSSSNSNILGLYSSFEFVFEPALQLQRGRRGG